MVVFWILAVLVLIFAISMSTDVYGIGDRIGNFILFGIIGSVFAILILLVVNGVGSAFMQADTNTTYTQKLASLKDGTGIQGDFYGGLFVSRGQIGDTQNFSYYVDNGNGSYRLDKRDATQSTIWQDASAGDAHVDITDTIHSCKPANWWFLGCGEPTGTFVHADFHVPADSIKQDFELDAQ